MKILEIDYDYYYYPKGTTCISEFIEYANAHYNSFIELTQLETEKCVFPYMIEEDTTTVYVNIAKLIKIQEVEASILCRADYEKRLKSAVEKKCIDCVNYKEDSEGDNLNGHREKLSLDGECCWYQREEK